MLIEIELVNENTEAYPLDEYEYVVRGEAIFIYRKVGNDLVFNAEYPRGTWKDIRVVE